MGFEVGAGRGGAVGAGGGGENGIGSFAGTLPGCQNNSNGAFASVRCGQT